MYMVYIYITIDFKYVNDKKNSKIKSRCLCERYIFL